MTQFRNRVFIDALKQDVPAIILYVRSRIMEDDGREFTVTETSSSIKCPNEVDLNFIWVTNEPPDLQWATNLTLNAAFPLTRGGHGSTQAIGEDYEGTFPCE